MAAAPSEKSVSEDHLMKFHTEVVEKTVAAKSFDKSGKIIDEDHSALQLKIGDIVDNRLLIAITRPKQKVGESFNKKKFVPLKLADGNIVLVSIASLAARLHISKDKVQEYMKNDNLDTALIYARAKEVQNKLKEYDNIIKNNSAADLTALKISQKNFEKVVRKAVTDDLDGGKKIIGGSLFKKVKFIAARDVTDESKPVLLLTKIKVLGEGACAKVSEYKNLASPNETFVTKRALGTDFDRRQIRNEFNVLNYLWKANKDNEPLVGIQPRSKAIFKFNKKKGDKVGFIITKHDGDLNQINDIYKKNNVLNIELREEGALQLLKGLEYMQDNDLVHGDIKAANIGCKIGGEKDNPKFEFFFADYGDANKPSNFKIRTSDGFQKDVGNSNTPSHTCPRTAKALTDTAKLAFENNANEDVAKVHVAKYKELQFKRDVYSTGLVLYGLLTGNDSFYLPRHPPTKENAEGEIDLKKFKENLESAGTNPKKIDVVMSMVDPDPEKRITSKQALELFKIVLEPQPSQVLEQSLVLEQS